MHSYLLISAGLYVHNPHSMAPRLLVCYTWQWLSLNCHVPKSAQLFPYDSRAGARPTANYCILYWTIYTTCYGHHRAFYTDVG